MGPVELDLPPSTHTTTQTHSLRQHTQTQAVAAALSPRSHTQKATERPLAPLKLHIPEPQIRAACEAAVEAVLTSPRMRAKQKEMEREIEREKEARGGVEGVVVKRERKRAATETGASPRAGSAKKTK